MVNISKLYCGGNFSGDALRYGKKINQKPIIVWNITRTCNLKCVHCYSNSENKKYTGEFTTKEAEGLIKDLAEFGIPVILFSGGEPLLRKDIFHLASVAKTSGMEVVLSTNGTLINKTTAKNILKSGIDYVGVSIDGIGQVNDKFRGSKGAFTRTLSGIRNCMNLGIKVGLRFTMTQQNIDQISEIFNLAEQENIRRICFYHLVYSGRAANMNGIILNKEMTRSLMEYIFWMTAKLYARGLNTEVLTVDNHADGPYLYMKLLKDNRNKAEKALTYLKRTGGNGSGIRIACVDNVGNVYPDQFWRSHSFGNVRINKFSEIWENDNDSFRQKLRERKKYLKGRCAQCRWLDICNGNFRARAEAFYKDIWAEDPGCYLTDTEIQQ